MDNTLSVTIRISQKKQAELLQQVQRELENKWKGMSPTTRKLMQELLDSIRGIQ